MESRENVTDAVAEIVKVPCAVMRETRTGTSLPITVTFCKTS